MSSERPLSLTEWKPWDGSETAQRLREVFQGAIQDEFEFRGERTLVVDPEQVADVLAFLKDEAECNFAMLSDVTATHWPGRDAGEFDVQWHLYSFARNVRLRVQCRIHAPRISSATGIWVGADWMERECYDMFGIVFEGHPNMRRILMPDDYVGHPLRKEFPLKG